MHCDSIRTNLWGDLDGLDGTAIPNYQLMNPNGGANTSDSHFYSQPLEMKANFRPVFEYFPFGTLEVKKNKNFT